MKFSFFVISQHQNCNLTKVRAQKIYAVIRTASYIFHLTSLKVNNCKILIIFFNSLAFVSILRNHLLLTCKLITPWHYYQMQVVRHHDSFNLKQILELQVLKMNDRKCKQSYCYTTMINFSTTLIVCSKNDVIVWRFILFIPYIFQKGVLS